MSVRLEQRAAPRARVVAARRPEVNFERLRAPFSLRCGALLVDYILVVGVVALATLLERAFGDARSGGLLLMTGYIAALAVGFLNFVVVAGLSGRTLGKWVAGLRIERRDGVPLSFGRALHDLLAGTVLVRSRRTRG